MAEAEPRLVAEAEPRHFPPEARRRLSVQQDRQASASRWCGRRQSSTASYRRATSGPWSGSTSRLSKRGASSRCAAAIDRTPRRSLVAHSPFSSVQCSVFAECLEPGLLPASQQGCFSACMIAALGSPPIAGASATESDPFDDLRPVQPCAGLVGPGDQGGPLSSGSETLVTNPSKRPLARCVWVSVSVLLCFARV
jgi:hypothetical protein